MHDSFNEQLVAALRAMNPALTDGELEIGLGHFQRRTFQAKDLISKAGRSAPKLFFAQRSVTRCFYLDADGEEQTLWMKPEQTFIAEYKSFTSGERSQLPCSLIELRPGKQHVVTLNTCESELVASVPTWVRSHGRVMALAEVRGQKPHYGP
ncbi:MAG: hypothetical protein AAGH79_18755, partial [Bacteroidota bacterium]